MTLEEKIRIAANSPYGVREIRYSNSIQLQGFILDKPKIIKSTNTGQNKESASFWVHQVWQYGVNVIDKSFYVITYSPTAIEKLKALNHLAFVNIVGILSYNRKVRTTQVQCELLDFNFELDVPFGEQE